MPTFVAMLTWGGSPAPLPDAVRAGLEARLDACYAAGLHSLVFLPDERECAAVMVASCADAAAVERLAAAVYPAAPVRVESLRFDGEAPQPAPPGVPPPGYMDAVYEAVAGG